MIRNNIIVHLIWRNSNSGGFAVGYINFMKLRMPEYEHHFFVKASGADGSKWDTLKLCDQQNMHYYDNLLSAMRQPDNSELLCRCRKIIVSGHLLSWKDRAFLILSGLASKTYLHFWDVNFEELGDFRRNIFHPRRALGKFIRHQLIKRAAGIINLIDGDLASIMRTFPNNTKHFVAPMPGNPLGMIDFEAFRSHKIPSAHHRILVAHSAHPASLHIESFHMLEHLKEDDIEIVCPLSYGIPDYRDKVIAEGRRIFGEKFTPITKLMPKEDYISLLNSCDAGVFITYYQQGMGNIWILLTLGKKVYIREDTSMWQHFRHNLKFSVYPVSELEDINLERLVTFPEEQAYNNIHIAEEYAAGNQAVTQWRKVFED